MSRGYTNMNREGQLEKVQQFVVYLYEHIREKNIMEIRSMYSRSFYRLSEMYFKDSPWPPVQYIAEYVDSDEVFCLLYQELYYRHLYANLWPSIEDRQQSWETYCQLFDVILHGNVTMQLPNDWLWDMIDEFMYQFQAFHQFKGKTSQHSHEEREAIKFMKDEIWNILHVMNYMQAIVQRSGIEDYLERGGEQDLLHHEGFEGSQSNVSLILGYVSLIGLSRVHALIGDYGGSLKALGPINIHDHRSLFAKKIPGAFITLHYYVGFSYLMMRRYVDASKCLNIALLYLPGVKEFIQDKNKLTQLERKEEQMFQLLAILVALCPRVQKQCLDDRISESLMEQFADKVQGMRRGNMSVYDELFSSGCPRFINPNFPDFSRNLDTNQESYQNQLKLFLEDVRQNIFLPDLLQYMQLYSSISLDKLSVMLDSNPEVIRTQLMCMKNRQYARAHNDDNSDVLSGEFHYAGNMEFSLDIDIETGVEYLMVEEGAFQKSHAQTLLRHIHKFQGIIEDLKKSPIPLVNPSQ